MSDQPKSHAELLAKIKEFTIYYLDGKDSEKITSCRIRHMDSTGITFQDGRKLGKNRLTFIPMGKIIRLVQELI